MYKQTISMLILLSACLTCHRDQLENLLEQGTEIIGRDVPLNGFELRDGSMEKHYGSMHIIPSDHPMFDSAFVVSVDKLTIFSWDLMLVKTVDAGVSKGEKVYVEFYAKAIQPKPQTSLGQISVKFNSFLIFPVEVDTVWQKFASWAVAEKDVAASESQLRFECGFEPQVVSIAGIRFYKFAPDFNARKIPGTIPLYQVDREWENEADRRIDSLRKGMATLTLTDETGNPLPSCEYTIEMVNHAFKWGTAVGASFLVDTSAEAEKFRQVLKQDFNHVVFENHLKWVSWDNLERRSDVFRSIQWLQDNVFEIRGHCLVWPWYDFPRQLRQNGNDTALLVQAIHKHIVEEATALRGSLLDWDVLNEPFVAKDTNNVWVYRDVRDLAGDEGVVGWYRTVHSIDPQARLFINDFDILSDGALFEIHKDHYEDFIDMLLQQGAPLHGIGFQCHFEGTLTPPEKVYEVLDRYAGFGLPLLVTEFDVDMSAGHEEEMYQFTRDFMKICFSHPSFDGFLIWGFWSKRHWKPRTAFYDDDWHLRPGGKAWKDLIYGDWWTTASGKTDDMGRLSFRGFYGLYELTYLQNGKQVEKKFRLEKEGISWL